MCRSPTYSSVAKELRSLRRLLAHLKKKLPSAKHACLVIQSQPNIEIKPARLSKVLSHVKLSSISIRGVPKPRNMVISKPDIFSIPPSSPKPQYHPYILEACRLMYGGKHPEQLTPQEEEYFKGFQQWKIENGEPVEEDSLYKPT